MEKYIEGISVLFGVAYIILAARKNVWCWLMGIISSLLGVWLFYQTRLYAEAFLFSYYVVIGFYGWFAWRNAEKAGILPIITWSGLRHTMVIGTGIALFLLVWWILHNFTDAVMPLLDSFTTVFSFIATWMVAKRVLENWLYWIVIDAFTIYLYLSRGLELYAILSLVYTILAVYGFFHWRKDYRQQILLNEID